MAEKVSPERVLPEHNQELSYLSDVSPQDKPWDKHRKNANKTALIYRQKGFERNFERIDDCSRIIEFVMRPGFESGRLFKLAYARFCRVRLCPVCQWRKTKMWRARFFAAVPKILKDYPKHRFLFLTLTVKNCSLEDLRETITLMNKAWGRMTKRKKFSAVGWVKSVEITKPKFKKGESEHSLKAHPHFHAILMVKPSYFKGKNYLSKEAWSEMWKSCLKVDYNPVVDVRAIKPKFDGSEDVITQHTKSIEKALMETLKYSVKDSDFLNDPDWLEGLTIQLHKTRSVALGGIFKEYISNKEPENLINSENADDEILATEGRLLFGWRDYEKRYRSL